MTMLSVAVEEGYLDAVKVLLKHGRQVDINVPDLDVRAAPRHCIYLSNAGQGPASDTMQSAAHSTGAVVQQGRYRVMV